ncbi:MAG: 4-hydroxy-tetrahydrodipicolinate reductase [Muribaculaceae bacterium]|nr:4-hydroxy-tetrahydrodipicolinate reductase [Muribaculaceae bacterium]
MKIALIGHGKMGHAIEKIARERGHEIVAIIDADNTADMGSEAFASADAAIEFTTPSTAAANVERAVAKGVPVVCGSTGWYDAKPQVDKAVLEAGTALIASTNFSVGVYVTRLVSKYLAGIMGHLPQYTPSLTETHHIHKLDYPSGTALTMAADIVEADPLLNTYESIGEVRVDEEGTHVVRPESPADSAKDSLPVLAIRRGEVPGIHTVEWTSDVDTITLTHEAKSREGFALGAVMAAEWILGKKGVFSIDDMMNDILNTSAK